MPHGVYRCLDRPGDGPARDRWCAIAVFGEDDWRRFCRVLGDPAWARDERFATQHARLANAAALDAQVQSWTACYAAEEVMSVLQGAGIAAPLVCDE